MDLDSSLLHYGCSSPGQFAYCCAKAAARFFLSLLPAPSPHSSQEQRQAEDRGVKKWKPKYIQSLFFVIITVIILVKLILLTYLTRCWSVCNFFFNLELNWTRTLGRNSGHWKGTDRVLAEEIHTQPWSWWNGQCPWEYISGGYSWNYLKARGFQDEAALFITEIKIKEIKR